MEANHSGGGAHAAAIAYQPSTEELAQDAVVWATQHGLVPSLIPRLWGYLYVPDPALVTC